MDIIETIKEQIEKNPVLLYMKGSPNAPQCGFSARATQALMGCGEKFAYVDILPNGGFFLCLLAPGSAAR